MALTDEELRKSREASYRFAAEEIRRKWESDEPLTVEGLAREPFNYREDFAADFLAYAKVQGWLIESEAQQAEASGAASPYSLLDNVTVTGSEGPDPKMVHGLAKMLTPPAKAESEARGDE